MSDFKKGDRVVVLRLGSDEVELHASYAGGRGPIMFALLDDDDLPDPVEVGARRPRLSRESPARSLSGRIRQRGVNVGCLSCPSGSGRWLGSLWFIRDR